MKLFKKWLTHGCIYYTVFSLIMIVINLMLASENATLGISLYSFFMLFPCGLAFAAAGFLVHTPSLPRWARYLLHYCISLLSLYLFFWRPAGVTARGSTMLILLLMMSALYWMLFGLYKLLKSRIRRLMEKD